MLLICELSTENSTCSNLLLLLINSNSITTTTYQTMISFKWSESHVVVNKIVTTKPNLISVSIFLQCQSLVCARPLQQVELVYVLSSVLMMLTVQQIINVVAMDVDILVCHQVCRYFVVFVLFVLFVCLFVCCLFFWFFDLFFFLLRIATGLSKLTGKIFR